MSEEVVIGLDLSLNHVGMCLIYLHNPSNVEFGYITDKKGEMKSGDGYSAYYLQPRRKEEDPDNFALRRIHLIDVCIPSFLAYHELSGRQFYFSIEGYAYSSMSRTQYQIGELGGVIRHDLSRIGWIRIHDPQSVKLWATGKGNATKQQMFEALVEIKGEDLPFYRLLKQGKKDLEGVGTDMVDAYWLADMLRVELGVRAGEILLRDLPENRRRVFLRTTKQYPVNLLDRPFIHRETLDGISEKET